MLTPFHDSLPIATLLDFAGSTVPSLFLDCDGSAVSRTTYADLYAAIGTTWGSGDGSTTFNLPDLRGRASVGAGTGSGLTARSLAATGGAETHQLTTSELPSHTHTFDAYGYATGSSPGFGYGVQDGAGGPASGSETNARGSDTAHNNMQPFAVVKKIIKALPG